MGGGGGFLGLGGGGGGGNRQPQQVQPDNSAYERQLAEQKEATRKAEEKAERVKAESNDALKRQSSGRLSTLLTGADGDDDASAVKRRALLGTGQ